ncbi:MAG: Aromatic-amino-acid aminotransferase 2 [Candidatus Woesearchaeota archaeon]|nr:Aromatic-amino-acid aminotransferase 2 [Candidatus Woesearchaeota archaeon]
MKWSNRIRNISYAVREVVKEAKQLEKQGKNIIYLNIGDPIKYDFDTSEHLHNAVYNKKHITSYGDSLGLEQAREAIAKKSIRDGADVTKEDVVITSGGSEAINFCIGALMNPGENILIPKPDYPLYSFFSKFFGGEDNFYYLNEQNGWQPDVDNIRENVNEKTRAIVIINPNNPTGNVYSKKILQQVVDIAAEHNLIILSDETYDQIIFDGKKHIPMASIADDVPVITMNSMSKNYLVPGWRIGWMVMHDPENKAKTYLEGIKRMARARLSAVHHHQFGIAAGLEGTHDHITEMIKKLQNRRDITYQRLNKIDGISCVKPEAAFYAFPKIEMDIESDKKFIRDLLYQKGVLFVHGSGFGQKPGTKHFRVVFLAPPKILNKAFDKLEKFTGEINV